MFGRGRGVLTTTKKKNLLHKLIDFIALLSELGINLFRLPFGMIQVNFQFVIVVVRQFQLFFFIYYFEQQHKKKKKSNRKKKNK